MRSCFRNAMRTMNDVSYIGTYLWAQYLSPSNGRNYDGNSSQDAVKQIMEPQESINHFPSTIQDLLLQLWTIVFCTQNCFV